MKIHRTLLLLSASLIPLFGASASAQTPAAVSESYTLAARATAAGSGSAAGALYAAQRASVGLATDGGLAKSSNYWLEAGMAWIEPQLTSGPPVLLGVLQGGGDSDGGVAARVLGFNLEDPAGVPTVIFAGQPATSVVESSNTALDVITPSGENAFGNPLGSVNVRVLSSLGSDNADDAYVYRPALLQETTACFGCTLTIELQASPGAFHMLARGSFVPGLALPLPPIEGALEIATGIVPLTGLVPTATGTAQYQLPIPSLAIPPFEVELQAVALDSLAPLGGSFTNRLTVTVGP